MANPVSSAALQGLPSADSPLVALSDGKITSGWYALMRALWIRTGQSLGVVTQSAVDSAAAAKAAAAAAQASADAALAASSLALLRAKNLDDIPSPSTARANLGLGSAALNNTGDFLQPSTAILVTEVDVGANKVVGARQTGWTAPTGSPSRGTFNASWTQSISNPPTQAEVQALVTQIQVLSTRLAALEVDLTTHGLIGA